MSHVSYIRHIFSYIHLYHTHKNTWACARVVRRRRSSVSSCTQSFSFPPARSRTAVDIFSMYIVCIYCMLHIVCIHSHIQYIHTVIYSIYTQSYVVYAYSTLHLSIIVWGERCVWGVPKSRLRLGIWGGLILQKRRGCLDRWHSIGESPKTAAS